VKSARALAPLWHRGVAAIGRHPSVYLPFARRRYGRDLAFGPDTEIVIEGFPRSANSFAVNAFRLAQARPVRIALHLHAPAQVLAAGHDRVPAIVLVREPREAIVSYLLWQPGIGVRLATRSYLSFYRTLEPYESSFVVASFGQVTTAFGAVIRRVNHRFGTSFREFEHTDANVRTCFAEIERHSRERRGQLLEAVVARPSAERSALKADADARYLRDTPAATRRTLEEVYQRYATLAAAAVAGAPAAEPTGRGAGG
jgi:hypothetical protein